MITIKKVEFNSSKNCISISNGDVEVIVTTEVGPRIISFSKNKKANHLAVFDEDFKGKNNKDEFKLYGGHRVWHAPEIEGRSNKSDNFACEYELTQNGANVFSTDNETKITKGVSLIMEEDGTLIVRNMMRNFGAFDIELSIWGITQFQNGGLLVVPNSKLDTALVANRAVSLWPYTKMNDKRIYFGDKYITLTNDNVSKPFKFGTTCDEQYVAYFNHNQLVTKQFDYFFDADYPNYFCNFESYTCSSCTELESLSPLFTLESGEIESHTEIWRIFDDISCPKATDETEIEKALSSPLKEILKS